MKVRLPLMVLDQFEAIVAPDDAVERFIWDTDNGYADDVFLDGPVTSRVAILDFDEETGQLHDPVELGGTNKVARYLAPDGAPGAPGADINDRAFQSVSVLGAVLYSLHMFEGPDVLGRRVEWAFDSNQLLVVPRAGTWRNAYYERESASLQFFSFPGDEKVPVVHTSLSLDIVSHEAGHAILDAIAPYLYDCVTPQSLALHEAVGDLTALFASLTQSKLRDRLLEAGNGDIEGSNSYTRVATAFGFYGSGDESLRNLWNDKTINDVTDPTDAHALSEVLTGMVYEMVVATYKRRWSELSGGGELDIGQRNKALALAGKLVRRLVLRGLDYLPPGEVCFADYIRAIMAADHVSNPADGEYRTMLLELCETRGLGTWQDLDYVHDPLLHTVHDVDIDQLVTSDWHAYQFVEERRALFHIPFGTSFLIEPRLVVTKSAFHTQEQEVDYHETIMKVSWEELEDFGDRPIWVRFGTTIAFDSVTGAVTAVVTTNPVTGQPAIEPQEMHRVAMVRHLDDNGFLDHVDATHEHRDGLIIHGTGRTLHAARHGHGPALDVEDELSCMDDLVQGMQP